MTATESKASVVALQCVTVVILEVVAEIEYD